MGPAVVISERWYHIALQLKAVSLSVEIIMSNATLAEQGPYFLTDISLVVALLLAGFAVIFGTRHADATEHQNGLILAVATESVIKLFAFTAVGLFVTFFLFSGQADLMEQTRLNERVMASLTYETAPARWIVLTMLSALAIVFLPRQFHVTVVENRTESELRTARFLFPLYLIAINVFVIPIAIAGLLMFGGSGIGDQFVLLLLAQDLSWLSLANFIGGFSAATAMVIVASVTVAIMISNDLVMPFLVRRNVLQREGDASDFTGVILKIRRTAIFCILLLGYAYYRTATVNAGLALHRPFVVRGHRPVRTGDVRRVDLERRQCARRHRRVDRRHAGLGLPAAPAESWRARQLGRRRGGAGLLTARHRCLLRR